MKPCIFCSKPADSHEHVIPQWIYKKCGDDFTGTRFFRGRYVEGKGLMEEGQPLPKSVKSKIVCEDCNGGWMSDLETQAIKSFGLLCELEWPVLHRTVIEQVRDDRDTLTRWLMKTAACCLFALPSDERMPDEDLNAVYKNLPIRNVWVDLAHCEGDGVVVSFLRGFQTINGGRLTPNMVDIDGQNFHFVIQINHLLLRIGRAVNAHVQYRTDVGPVPFRIYPEPDKTIPRVMTFSDFQAFQHAVVLNTWKGCKEGGK